MSELLPQVEDVRAGVVHGTFCPKMCNHVCPVFTATGRDSAAPWGLHTLQASVIGAVGAPHDSVRYADLRGCTGCHACQAACLYDLDVPRELRATRAVLVERDVPVPVQEVLERVRDGRSPYGHRLPEAPASDSDPAVTVLCGCADPPEVLGAVVRLLAAAEISAAYHVPEGCCGRLLADLGAATAASGRVSALGEALGSGEVVAIDPHCVAAARETGAAVTDIWSFLADLVDDDRLRFAPGTCEVAFHDPCVLARDLGVIGPPRRVLAAAGLRTVEPEGHARATVCSGAGMGFDLIAPEEAQLVARRRSQQLEDVARPVVTACSRARARLSSGSLEVRDALVVLADRLPQDRGGRRA